MPSMKEMTMTKRRRKFTAQEKVAILREHLIDRTAVSDVCDRHGLNPTVFYRWQKEFFENGAAAFERRNDAPRRRLDHAAAFPPASDTCHRRRITEQGGYLVGPAIIAAARIMRRVFFHRGACPGPNPG